MSHPPNRPSRKLTARLLKVVMVTGAILAGAILLGLRFYSAEYAVDLN